jgi:hypothetical protein
MLDRADDALLAVQVQLSQRAAWLKAIWVGLPPGAARKNS